MEKMGTPRGEQTQVDIFLIIGLRLLGAVGKES